VIPSRVIRNPIVPGRRADGVVGLGLVLGILVGVLARAGESAEKTDFFSPATFESDAECQWKRTGPGDLRMNAFYIAGPAEGQNRDAWLNSVRTYRDKVRANELERVLETDYHGVRAWTRLAVPVAKAFALKRGETLRVAVDARWLAGGSELCVAFDVHEQGSDVKVGWTGVRGTARIAKDQIWHRAEAAVEIPDFDASRHWLRPIFGMDGTHDPTPSRMEISKISLGLDDADRIKAASLAARLLPGATGPLDWSLYDRSSLNWVAHGFACHFTFMYDRAFYDPKSGSYTLDSFLDDGEKEFGGYDSMVLWQGYPRLGVDERNQFDMYRDMPGGLEGLRELIGHAHDRGVKVFIDYNPWDRGTRREDKADEESLADLVKAIEADGIFLDTMSAGSKTLRNRLDQARPEAALVPEGHPGIDQLELCSGSWAQGLTDAYPPGMLHLKWIEPRHMQYQISRWEADHRLEIETAFFNGSGMLVWENVFGTYNPWRIEDRRTWRRLVRILRRFAGDFTGDRWEPFYPTLIPGLYAHCWLGEGYTLFTLLNHGQAISKKGLVDIGLQTDCVYYDLQTGEPLQTERTSTKLRLIGSVDRVGCILATHWNKVDVPFKEWLIEQQHESAARKNADERNEAKSVVDAEPVQRTHPVSQSTPPPGMVFVPGATIRMVVEHPRRECGCYPDPGTSQQKWKDFLWGAPHDGRIRHDIGPIAIKGFFIDEAEVTNAEFKTFLDATGYRPEQPANFLKHWPDGQMPAELADHPVVYVDLPDARAYAKWAGKRLPAESEWHLAAQGTDGRTWPWGKDFDAARCNTTGDHTLPAKSCPDGRSPYGCYHMAGNVWEWTESVRDDGHTRFAIIRGGSYFDAKDSIWYVRGGPQPCTHHAKFLLMWSGLDRCATIGFRCVTDME
jgi:gamma-glutamyl hercynylcysteine S-oxide synthase